MEEVKASSGKADSSPQDDSNGSVDVFAEVFAAMARLNKFSQKKRRKKKEQQEYEALVAAFK
jgi:hypothetical protein